MTETINDQNFTIWKNLFEAAVRFRDQKPWKYFNNSHVFGVQDPNSDTIGWCVIMGSADTAYGMQVYQGDEGFEGYVNIMNSWMTGMDPTLLSVSQKGLIFNLVNKDETDDVDEDIYQRLDYSFRGKNKHISFRRLDPGFYPWYLTDKQVVFMKHCLEQALQLVEMDQKNDVQVTTLKDGKLVVMVPEQMHDDLIWSPRMVPHPEPLPSYAYTPTKVLINKIQQKLKKDNTTLMLSIQYIYSPIQDDEGEQPYFPKVIVWADEETELILDMELTHPMQIWNHFQKNIQNLFNDQGYIPTRIIAGSDMAIELMEEIAERLQIELIFDPEHPFFIDIENSMDGLMG